MNPQHRLENDRSLQQLAWTIQASVGQFKLIWARCNYRDLRDRLIEKLGEVCPIQVLRLKRSQRRLYSAIRSELRDDSSALMIVGWESLQDLPQMLTSANQIREEFRNFSIPLVLWVNDRVHQEIMEIAPDLESWGISKTFAIAPDDLAEFLQRLGDRYFNHTLKLSLHESRVLESELKTAQRELHNDNQEVEGNLLSLLGIVKQVNSQFDVALEFHQRAIAIWEKLNNSVKRGKVLSDLVFCYCLKALKEPDINHPDWEATRRYAQEYINFLDEVQRPDLVASTLVKFGYILQNLEDWENLEKLTQQSLQVHQAGNYPIELAKDYGFLAQTALGRSHWSEAKRLAEKSLDILSAIPSHELINISGIVAELSQEAVISQDSSLYRYILAQSEYHLGEVSTAISHLETARDAIAPEGDLRLHLNILKYLQRLYFQEKAYLKAYETKQQMRSVEQQFGLRAFIGAGRLQSIKQTQVIPSKTENQENIATEISASGRLLDVERLLERVGRLDYKLIVVHGQSGVGKSSLINAGLVPALKKKAIGIQTNLPVVIRSYTNWIEELERLIQKALQEIGRNGLESPHPLPPLPQGEGENIKVPRPVGEGFRSQCGLGVSPSGATGVVRANFSTRFLISQLRENEQDNLRTVLIFDQFEEFFFVYSQPAPRREFFEFLGECLNILSVKIILSLRMDYLHYLLECNRLSSLNIIGNDILSKNVLYELGNFFPDDTKSIIQRLTQTTSFKLEAALIDQLVHDLAGEMGEVRPIELQIVGAQLQTENIKNLVEYQRCGTKEELVKRYLNEVVGDCGGENQQIAELLLYLLTDEKGTRPLKTRIELERDLQALTTNTNTDGINLDLVLEIFVKSGLVLLLPENPFDRYQLVHDYIALFIRQQQEPKLNQLILELEQERRQHQQTEAELKAVEKARLRLAEQNQEATRRIRVGSAILFISFVIAGIAVTLAKKAYDFSQEAQTGARLERQGITAWENFQYQEIESLLSAMQAGQELQEIVKDGRPLEEYPAASPELALQTILDNIHEKVQLKGHTDSVLSANFSPDGKRIVTASSDKTARVWDLNGQQLTELKGHTDSVRSANFSPDGKRIVTASEDNTARVWDLNGQQLTELKGHTGSVLSANFSPDGKRIVTASEDNTARVWDLNGQQLTELKGHTGSVLSANFSPDGKRIVTASSDKTARVWDLNGQQLTELKGHTGYVWSANFSLDGKRIVTASWDNTARVWDLNGQQLTELKGHTGSVLSANFSPDGKRIVTASSDKTARVWDLNGQQLTELKGHTDSVLSANFSPDGKRIVTASSDKTARVWDLNGQQLTELKGHTGYVWSANFSPDGKRIVTASWDNTARVWDLNGQQLTELKGHTGYVWSANFSPDGKRIVTASWDNTARVWDLNGQQLTELKGHTDSVLSANFSPDGKRIVTASSDKTARVWDLNGQQLTELKGHTDSVWSANFSPDGKRIVTASSDKTARVWDLNGQQLTELKGHTDSVWSANFSPDGKRIVTASWDKTARVWDLNGQQLTELKGHTGYVGSANFSPDGKRIVTASSDKTARVWDLNGQQLTELKGHTGSVLRANFSPDGNRIVTASEDNTARVWEVDNLNELLDHGCQWLNDYLVTNPKDLEMLKVCQTPSNLIAAAPFLVKEGENEAKAGNIDNAIAIFQKAFQWNPNLKFDAKARAIELANKRKD